MLQILGKNGNEPVKFVICWTPTQEYENSSVGGTGYAIRCALDHKIKIFNLINQQEKQELENFIGELEK